MSGGRGMNAHLAKPLEMGKLAAAIIQCCIVAKNKSMAGERDL